MAGRVYQAGSDQPLGQAQILVDEQFHILMCLDICNNARERPRAAPPSVDDYRPPPPVLPALIADRAPPEAA